MQVLNFHSDLHRETSVDVFVTSTFDFDAEYAIAMQGELSPGTVARFVLIPTLIAMKEIANRARDRDDIDHLRWILDEKDGDDRRN